MLCRERAAGISGVSFTEVPLFLGLQGSPGRSGFR